MSNRPLLSRVLVDTSDLHVRSEQRTVCGIAVPFGVRTEIREFGEVYDEEFAPGAFSRTIAERGVGKVKFLIQHDRGLLPVGRATLLREDREGLYAELRISETPLGDEVLTLIRDEVINGLSVGFEPVTSDATTRGLVVRQEVKLREISAVPWPAYETATITGMRGRNETPTRDLARSRTEALRARYEEIL